MSVADPFGMTDKLNDTLPQVIITRLEARAKHPVFARMLQEYLDVMHIDVAQTVSIWAAGPGSPPGRLLVDCVLPAGSSALISVPPW